MAAKPSVLPSSASCSAFAYTSPTSHPIHLALHPWSCPQEATEALNQIIGYFPAELSVGELERPQKEFVLRALAAARTNLVSFIALLPPDIVKSALDQVRKENELNAQDYQRIFGEPMLNVPSEPGSAKPAPKPEPAEGAAPKPAKRGSPFAAARKSKSPE